jgi:hypothetical protein
MLDELIRRHGRDVIVTARPWVNDEGETDRWFVEIDGVDVSDVDLRVRSHGDRGSDVPLLERRHSRG